MNPSLTRLPGAWYRVEFTLGREDEELAVTLLHSLGTRGAATRPAGPGRVGLTAWFDDRADAERAATSIAAIGSVRPRAPRIDEERDPGWLEASTAPRSPIVAGRFLLVSGDDALPARVGAARQEPIELAIPRGRAFGTGEHPTTRMCLELLGERLRSRAAAVLDLGTGSGILAIAAALAGARPVLAIDNDPSVMEVAAENARRNGVADAIELRVGSWSGVAAGRAFDVVVANIHRTTLVRAADTLARHVAPGGVAILSGFPAEDAGLVADAWRRAGCEQTERLESEEWVALEVRNSSVRSDD